MNVATIEQLNPAAELEYNANVVRLFTAPLHAGSSESLSEAVSGTAGSRAQGASVRLSLQFTADNRVKAARFAAYGCPHFIAAAEHLCAWVEGRARGELKDWNWREVASYLDVPSVKRARLLVLDDALRHAAGA